MLHTALITLLFLSSSFADESDDGKQRQTIVQNAAGENPQKMEETPSKLDENPPKMEGKETLVGDNSGGSEVEAAKDAS